LDSSFEQYDAATRVLVMTSPAFDFPSCSLPGNVRYVGMPFENAAGETWKSPWPQEESRPLVLASLSTAPQGQGKLLHRILGALAELPVRALVTLGPSLPADEFLAPANVVLSDFVPHNAVFPGVDALVSQCGHGTVMKALAHGVPIVCVPLLGDQNDVAARVVHAGAGIRLRSDAAPLQIRSAIQRILEEPQFRNNARRLRDAMRREHGARAGASELEALLKPS
jgi:MGT family glycosyltransferase